MTERPDAPDPSEAHAFDPGILLEVAGSYLLGDDEPGLTPFAQ